MSVKLRNLTRWKQLDGALMMPGGKRNVRLEVNVDRPTRFDVNHGTEKTPNRLDQTTLLRAVEPSECPVEIQFTVLGDCEVIPTTDGEVWYFTDDGAEINFAVTTKSFTSLEQRMEMTPEMELTITKANLAREYRRREQAELLLRKRQRDEARSAHADPETGEVDDEVSLGNDARGGSEAPLAGDGVAPEPQPAGTVDTAADAATASTGGTGTAKQVVT